MKIVIDEYLTTLAKVHCVQKAIGEITEMYNEYRLLQEVNEVSRSNISGDILKAQITVYPGGGINENVIACVEMLVYDHRNNFYDICFFMDNEGLPYCWGIDRGTPKLFIKIFQRVE